MPTAITDEQDWHASIIQKLMQPFSAVVARDLKDFTYLTASYTTEVVVALLLKPYIWPSPKKNCNSSMNFDVERMMLAFTGACKDKGITGQWPK